MFAVLIIAAQVVTPAWAGEDLTLATLCTEHPERIQRLFNALDLQREGLAEVKAAVDAADWPGACRALLAYYRTSDTAAWLRQDPPKPGNGRDPRIDEILQDQFTLYGLKAKVPRREDGGLDWTYNGPDGDREWGWGLNRMYWASGLHGAYHATGNPEYAEFLDAALRDWVLANPYPGKKTSAPQWRGLETFARSNSAWPSIFYGLQQDDHLTPVTRILMLSSVPDHAHYGRNFHAGGGNWIAMELLGLAKASACWPEFKDADAWFDYAMTRMIPEMTKQVYPDGVQKELTSHYHRVAMFSFNRFVEVAQRAERSIPPEFTEGVERMKNYTAYSMRPSGFGPLNNDSNLDFTRSEVLTWVPASNRQDWQYIASNGSEGTAPGGRPSVVFPWAGQVIMRNGWDADAHWTFFDVGPLGTGHQHYDKLHLSVSAYGRDILVDAGRYTYVGGDWRSYFVGSSSHNIILVDGHGQKAYAKEASKPMAGNFAITPEYDFARGAFDGGYHDVSGKAVHSRAVLYLRDMCWLVVDRFDTDAPRTLQALWHFQPDCTAVADGPCAASTDDGKGNVRITPLGGLEWKLDIVKGQTKPHIQGWWSREYNHKTESPCAVYTASVNGPATFAWLIVPAKGPVSPVKRVALDDTENGVTIEGELGTGETFDVTIPATGAECSVRTSAG